MQSYGGENRHWPTCMLESHRYAGATCIPYAEMVTSHCVLKLSNARHSVSGVRRWQCGSTIRRNCTPLPGACACSYNAGIDAELPRDVCWSRSVTPPRCMCLSSITHTYHIINKCTRYTAPKSWSTFQPLSSH